MKKQDNPRLGRPADEDAGADMINRPSPLNRVKKSYLVAIIAALCTALVYVSDVASHADSLWALLSHRPDALSVSEDNRRDDLSRQLIRAVWRRFACARTYVTRVKLSVPMAEQDEAWQRYSMASEDWNSNLMVYILVVDHYYGHRKSLELEENLQPLLYSMGDELVNLRYHQEGNPAIRSAADVATKAIDDANAAFYQFVSGFPQGHRGAN